MGPLNALCRPIFQRRNLTPILFCKHTHERDTFDLRILAAHLRTILSDIPKYSFEANFANWSCSQFLSPTDYCLPPHRPEAGWLVWGQVGSAVQILSSTIGLRYIRPTCFNPFPPFAKKEKEKKMISSSTSLRYIQPKYFHTFSPFATENLRTIHTFIMDKGQYSQTHPLWSNRKMKIISGWNAVGSSFWKWCSGVETFVSERRRMYNVHICFKNLIWICIIHLSFPHGQITIRQTKIQTCSLLTLHSIACPMCAIVSIAKNKITLWQCWNASNVGHSSPSHLQCNTNNVSG